MNFEFFSSSVGFFVRGGRFLLVWGFFSLFFYD